MRHKLDDTTAAMQELGRENQSLQVGLAVGCWGEGAALQGSNSKACSPLAID